MPDVGSVAAAVNHSSSEPAEASTSVNVATRCVQPSNHLVVDPALLAAMLASVSVTSSAERPSSLPPTMSSQSGSSQSTAGATQSVEGLLFYHRDPIVPIPAGMTPLPPLPSSERPSPPDFSSSSTQTAHYYMSYVSTLPGLDFMPWNMWRPRIESHRGFPKPYRPDFRAPSSREQALELWSGRLTSSNRRESPVRVLPPPPRPPVVVQGLHWWVVYIGRTPGIYHTE